MVIIFMARFVILLLYFTRSSFQKRHEIQLLGLFTTTRCATGMEFECANALVNQNSVLQNHRQKEFWYKTNICFQDMKNSSKVLMDTLLPLATDEKKHFKMNCQNKNGVYKGSLDQIFILTYLSFDLTRFASSIILPLDSFILISITDKPMYPAYLKENPFSIYSYEASFGVDIHNEFIGIKNRLNVTYLAFLNLGQGESNRVSTRERCATNPTSSAMCFYIDSNPGDCYKELNVNVNREADVSTAMDLVKKNNFSFLVIAGDSRSDLIFRSHAQIDKEYISKTFAISFLTKVKNIDHLELNQALSYKKGNVLFNVPGSLATNYFLYYAFNFYHQLLFEYDPSVNFKTITNQLLNNDNFQDLLRKNFGCQVFKFVDGNFKCGDKVTIKQWLKIPRFIIENALEQVLPQKDTVLLLISLWKEAYYIENISGERLFTLKTFNPAKALQSRPQCNTKKPSCKAGAELVHSFYQDNEWTQGYGWNCRPCQGFFYKTNPGNEDKCQKCSHPLIVNSGRTICYDPYTEFTLDPTKSWILFSVIIPSGVLTILTLLTMVAFLNKRETPIVKLANRKMTMLQLLNHLLLFVLPSYLFLITTPGSCLGRQIFLGLSFSITLSINISKSQKLFMIVGCKVRMSRSQILMTKASEWIIILFVLTVNGLLHLISLINKPVTIETRYFDSSLTKEYNCSNQLMIYVQLLMATILSVSNGIQGFRARKLPSRYQETNHVIYSSFISAIVFVASTAIYFTQESKVYRNYIVLLVTLIFNTIHFVLLYGYKLFVMLFQPQLNTKEFDRRRLKKIGLA